MIELIEVINDSFMEFNWQKVLDQNKLNQNALDKWRRFNHFLCLLRSVNATETSKMRTQSEIQKMGESRFAHNETQ